MTKQWQHRFITETGDVITSLTSPFDPVKFGMKTTAFTTTACRRGYVCEFRIKEKHCVLERLLIRLSPVPMDRGEVHIDDYPPLNGSVPRSCLYSAALYENVGLMFEFNLAEHNVQSNHASMVNPFSRVPKQCKEPSRARVTRSKSGKSPGTCSPRGQEGPKDLHYLFRDPKIMGYDIIGDIHGHADELEALLDKLGYSSDGKRSVKRRRLIFLGDLIDRGPRNRKVIEIVRNLIRKDLAYAIMGNHEYNAICYHTKSRVSGQNYLREHNNKNDGQHKEFLNEYPDANEREKIIHWFQRLPLFLDLGHFRIVHACWDQDAIDFVVRHYQNCLTDKFLHRSARKNTREFQVIETLLKGPELPLKDGHSFLDADRNTRTTFRLKWWESELPTFGDAAIIPDNALLEHRNTPLGEYTEENRVICYPQNAPPVIFGHYAKKSFGTNAICLDHGIIKGKELVALRWHKSEKDKPLSEMEIVKVQFKGKNNQISDAPHAKTIMEKVLYIHGLNGSPDNSVGRQLHELFGEIMIAPQFPENPATWGKIIEQIIYHNPVDILIIGNSTGGLFASYFGNKCGFPVVLLNPLIDADDLIKFGVSSEDREKLKSFEMKGNNTPMLVILGEHDDVLDSNKSKLLYANKASIMICDQGHQIILTEPMLDAIKNMLHLTPIA